MIIFNDLPSDIIFVIALLLHPADLYNLVLVSNKYAKIIKNRKVINYYLKEINEIVNSYELKYFILKHTNKKYGLYKVWYSNGQIYMQTNYQNDNICGLPNHHSNNQIYEQSNLQNNEKYGLCEIWHPNGQKMSRSNYQNGKMHGLYEFWYPNGQMKIRSNYQNGSLEGLFERWHSNGQKHLQVIFQGGTQCSLEEWDINGQRI